MKTTILSWLLLVLLFQSHWCSAIGKVLQKENGFHQLPQLPEGQGLQVLNRAAEFSKARRRGGESEELDAPWKVSHKGEGGAAGAGGGEADKTHGGANSDVFRRPRAGHPNAAPRMQVLYTSHLSTIPSIWWILVPLFFY
ncbi:hypothetical protein COCNU_11G012170 [Cocos nucifera]|uniref:Uncharacterized protein n=1 Tax=Cocos nucifera TaxID=13894 RepID=A0A8K0IQF9_COCNU|nr:hypothetical protein COCNU_11G012170 [Cocos nucifera]